MSETSLPCFKKYTSSPANRSHSLYFAKLLGWTSLMTTSGIFYLILFRSTTHLMDIVPAVTAGIFCIIFFLCSISLLLGITWKNWKLMFVYHCFLAFTFIMCFIILILNGTLAVTLYLTGSVVVPGALLVLEAFALIFSGASDMLICFAINFVRDELCECSLLPTIIPEQDNASYIAAASNDS